VSLADYDDDDDGDGLFIALVIAGAYVAYQFWRYRNAAAYGGGYFESTPPASGEGQGILNILIPLQLSPTGAAFIKGNEQLRLNKYPDGNGYSIGWGHHIQPGENIVSPITQAEADQLFAGDVATAEKAVSDSLLVQVSQSQFDSLVDLAFNIGSGAFRSSTLLQLLNQGDFAGAAGQFGEWIHSGGQVNSNLATRRAADLNLFTQGS
jgi:lysozyme